MKFCSREYGINHSLKIVVLSVASFIATSNASVDHVAINHLVYKCKLTAHHDIICFFNKTVVVGVNCANCFESRTNQVEK